MTWNWTRVSQTIGRHSNHYAFTLTLEAIFSVIPKALVGGDEGCISNFMNQMLTFCQYIMRFYLYKLTSLIEGDPKAPFSIAKTPRRRRGHYSFPGLLHFTLDPYLVMLSVKQSRIKYHFLSFLYDLTWDWTPDLLDRWWTLYSYTILSI